MDKRDQILAKLALGLGLVNESGYRKAAQLMVQFPGRSFDRILLDTRLISPAQHKQLIASFNQRLQALRQQQGQGQAPQRPAPQRPAPQRPAPQRPAPQRPAPQRQPQPERARSDLRARGLSGSDVLLPSVDAEPPAQGPKDGVWARSTAKIQIPDADEDDDDLLDISVPEDIFAEPTVVLKDEAEPTRAAPTQRQVSRPAPRDDVFDEATMVLEEEGGDDDVFDVSTMVLEDADDDEDYDDDVFAQPTMVLAEDEDDDVFAQPTMVLEDEKDDSDAVFDQPTMVLEDEKGGAEDPNNWGGDGLNMALIDSQASDLDLVPHQASDIAEVDMRLQRDVNKSSARLPTLAGGEETDAKRTLNSVEFQKRLKGRLGFAGFKIGDYKIRGEIARGAFGVVLRADPGGVTKSMAKDRGYEGTLALKVALENTADPRATERFVEETRVQIGFDHPHIVRIFDCGVEAGLTYYSMEKIEGIDARSYVIKNGPMPPLLAVRVCKEIALALAYVHKQRIYHRDLKPQNVLLDKACQPYRAVLIDFGLVTEHLSDADKGLILGTPSYMPPEQAQPRGGHGPINLTSDIYALGATFFYLLTGHPPFTDKSPRKIIKMVVENAPPDPVSLNDQVPRRVADVCLKCLEKRQRDRYHSAAQLSADLDKVLKSGQMKLKAKSFFGKFLGKKK